MTADMATEISVPTLKNSENYELWKQETLAWAVITNLDKAKQAIAVALNLPNDKNIKEKVFSELKLEDLKSENGMCILFDILDKYLLDDELMSSYNKFEDFENLERKYGQNIREYVSNFEMKVSKLEKLNIKLPSEILALKLLRKANLTKQERMIVLTGVNFDDKVNMLKEMKSSLIKFLGELIEGNARKQSDFRLEPAWKKSTSSHNQKWNGQHGNTSEKKKKLNPLGSDGQILLCNSCGSYRHLIAECPDSWENMVKGKRSQITVELSDHTDEQRMLGKVKSSGEESHFVDTQVGAEIAQLKEEIGKLKDEIKEIKAVKDKELEGQKEESLKGKEEMEKLKAELKAIKAVKDSGLKRQKEDPLKDKIAFEEEDEHREESRNGRIENQSLQDLGSKRSSMGTEARRKQARPNETKSEGTHWKVKENNETKQRLLEKAKRVKQKLQKKPGGDKAVLAVKPRTIDTDDTFQIRQWFWWHVERQLLNYTVQNDMALMDLIVNWVLKLVRSDNEIDDMQNIS